MGLRDAGSDPRRAKAGIGVAPGTRIAAAHPWCHLKQRQSLFPAGSGSANQRRSLLPHTDLWKTASEPPSWAAGSSVPALSALYTTLRQMGLYRCSPPQIRSLGPLPACREGSASGVPACPRGSASPPPAALICHCHLLNNCFSAVWPPRAALPARLLRASLICSVNLLFL